MLRAELDCHLSCSFAVKSASSVPHTNETGIRGEPSRTAMKSSHDSRGQAGLSGLWHGLQAHLETVGAAHTAQHHVVVLAARLPGRRHSPTAAPLGSRSDQVNRSTPQQALLPRLGSMGFATISAPPAPETMTADASAAGRIARASVPGNGLVSREDLGRATWLLLHTTAAQYPENPTRRQQRDMRMFVSTTHGNALQCANEAARM